ncbi:MAG TPA: phosphoribosyl-AMP cyclohydrolase [Ktedonobacteraceae bacterium]|nr:phosphoribosyl-AMP cyclohydrolase [Ktedonobacteraceae bacterium]
MALNFDRQGLIPAVIQDESNGQVLMVAFMNEEALRLTRETGYTHLFSRSRHAIWRKGEQSGNVQEVRDIYVNCEENSLLVKVVQHGPGACHTGHRSCYYRLLHDDDSYETVEERLFDPTEVYAGQISNLTPTPLVSEQEQQKLESDMRQLFSAYIFLRDHDMSTESNTSRLLQEQSIEYLVTRLGDELQELADVQAGVHVHIGRRDDTVLEASQVGYWLMLIAAVRNIKYDEVYPHEAILNGYAIPGPQSLEQAEECLSLLISEKREENIQGLIMGFTTIGRTCAEAGVSPLEPAEYDMVQMRRKGLVAQ